MRREAVRETLLIHCENVTSAAGERPGLRRGERPPINGGGERERWRERERERERERGERLAGELSFPTLLKSNRGSQGKMEAQLYTDLFGLHVVFSDTRPVALARQSIIEQTEDNSFYTDTAHFLSMAEREKNSFGS